MLRERLRAAVQQIESADRIQLGVDDMERLYDTLLQMYDCTSWPLGGVDRE